MTSISLRSYADFELWVGAPLEQGQGQYPVQVVVSPDGYGNTVMGLDLQGETFQADLVRVRSPESNLELRRQFGQLLFEALFTGEVRDRWKGSVGRIKGSSRPIGLRLLLKILDQELAVLPWELLYDQQVGGFLSASANQTVARFLPMAEPKGFQATDQLRVLLVVQSPAPGLSTTLDPIPDGEIAALQQTLDGLAAQGVTYKPLLNAKLADIYAELQQQEYHVLHYLGHGGPGELYFVAEENEAFSPVSDAEFAHYFRGRDSLRLVVLNACSSSQVEGAGLFSGMGPALVRAGFPAVIAMQYDAVYVDTAGHFSQHFYQGLSTGLPVDVAVNEARQFLAGRHLGDRDWSTPVLYMGTRTGRVLSLPGAQVDATQDPARLIELLNDVLDQLTRADATYQEVERRARRLREWLDVQSQLAATRSGVDRLNGYIQTVQAAVKQASQPAASPLDLERARFRFESVVDQWDRDCRQDIQDLRAKLEECTAIAQPDTDPSDAAKSSIAGWTDALETVRQQAQSVFGQETAALPATELAAAGSSCDNQGRQLRDWLRDRDTDCRTRLIKEADSLKSYTIQLRKPQA